MYPPTSCWYELYPTMYKFQQYQTNRYNSSYNSTWLNINQLYDDDQQSKQSIARQLDSTQQYSVNNIQF